MVEFNIKLIVTGKICIKMKKTPLSNNSLRGVQEFNM